MKKFKLLKLLSASPVLAIPLIAASCNQKDNGPNATQKALGENLNSWVTNKLMSKANYSFPGVSANQISSITLYEPGSYNLSKKNGKKYDVKDLGQFIIKYGNPTTDKKTKITTYNLDTDKLKIDHFMFGTLVFKTTDKKIISQDISIEFNVTLNANKEVTSSSYKLNLENSFIGISVNRLYYLINDKNQKTVTGKDLSSFKNFLKSNYSLINDALEGKYDINGQAVMFKNEITFAKNTKLPGAKDALEHNYQFNFRVNFGAMQESFKVMQAFTITKS